MRVHTRAAAYAQGQGAAAFEGFVRSRSFYSQMYEWRACSISHCITQVLSLAKGFRGRSKNCIRIARERVEKALQYAYRDRRTKKRDMRSLWIQRVNAASKEHGVCHCTFAHAPSMDSAHIDGLSNVQV